MNDQDFIVLIIGLFIAAPFLIKAIVTIASAAYFKQKLHYHRQVLNNLEKGEPHNGA